MKTRKTDTAPKLTVEQIVQKKLDKMNEMLRKVDLSTLPRRPSVKQD